ncbi:unnamed protein product [Notodromas monacha]|uniref:Metalloendopeptidase n=1 Tax=Notodromas monacha TaxID=399045 RepID=A0A7R9BKQ1_9CRUS|nr:unnamed protein product [Notodromas monacha]CAG0916179.1 unnamed protein product [Notodromas monacha]
MDLIHEAMDEIEKKTCVRFQRLKSDHGVKNFVHFTATNPLGGCWSSVGMDTRRSQVMNLQKPECWDKGVILHELVHNIGFYHEHQRPDRDNYIDVLYRNVRPDIEAHQFSKFPPHKVVDTGIPYDLDSIMHYDTHAFGIVDETGHPLPTILQKPPNQAQMILPIWARPYLSPLDAAEINHIYAGECRKRADLEAKGLL